MKSKISWLLAFNWYGSNAVTDEAGCFHTATYPLVTSGVLWGGVVGYADRTDETAGLEDAGLAHEIAGSFSTAA